MASTTVITTIAELAGGKGNAVGGFPVLCRRRSTARWVPGRWRRDRRTGAERAIHIYRAQQFDPISRHGVSWLAGRHDGGVARDPILALGGCANFRGAGAPGVTSGNPVWIFREWKDDAAEASAKEQAELKNSRSDQRFWRDQYRFGPDRAYEAVEQDRAALERLRMLQRLERLEGHGVEPASRE